MSTIVGLRCRDGVALAGDRVHTRAGRIESRNRQHVFGFDADPDPVGAAAVGADVGRFADRLESGLRSYRLERGPVSLAALERLASDLASETGSEAVVAARADGDAGADATAGSDADAAERRPGRASLRGVYADGSTLADPPFALGSGASLALGALEAAEAGSLSVSAAESFLADLFESVAERDPGTGAEIDVWTLADTDADMDTDADTETNADATGGAGDEEGG